MSDKKSVPDNNTGPAQTPAQSPTRTPVPTLGETLAERGVSRRSFLKFASYTASIMALPPTAATAIAQGLAAARRQSVIWLSFQECTGCTESITRAHAPSIEDLIFDFISLDYHHTLQNASGHAAEAARETAMKENAGEYIVVVDGSVPLKDDGIYSTIAGISNLQMLEETAKDAFAVIAVGSCAAFGGLPGANTYPTRADQRDRHRQANHQHFGLPTDPRGHDRHGCLPAVVRRHSGTRPSRPAARLFRRGDP
jgi:NiFe hydrogenase small subunit HydA